MGHNTTFRYSVSAILLALYAFIAMPVQLWHKHSVQHAYSRQGKVVTVSGVATDSIYISDFAVVKSKAVKTTQSIFVSELQIAGDNAENCKLCSHHYSSYLEGSSFLITINCPLSKISYSSFQPSFPLEEVLSFSNKGPPTTI